MVHIFSLSDLILFLREFIHLINLDTKALLMRLLTKGVSIKYIQHNLIKYQITTALPFNAPR